MNSARIVVAVVFLACSTIGRGGEKDILANQGAMDTGGTRAIHASDSTTKSKLTELPSPAGPHLEKLKQLEAGQWLNLGSPAPDPLWGKARGRSWTTNMPFAATLEGAFLFGEGKHGWYNKDNGRYMDDLWFYDVMAHRWINLHPGTSVTSPPDLTVSKDGFLAFADTGNPVPIATMVHGYQMTAWDPVKRRFMSIPCPGSYWKNPLPTVLAFVTANRSKLNTTNASPWFYDIVLDRWVRRATKMRSPSGNRTFGATFIYVPSIQQSFYRHGSEIWFYDSADNSWTRKRTTGPQPPFGIDATACYDSKRDRIYIGGGDYPVARGPNAFWIYDIESDAYIDPTPDGNPGSNKYTTRNANMHYDEKNGTVLLFRHGGAGRGAYAYQPDTNRWHTVSTELPSEWKPHWSTVTASSFYHPGLGLHFFHVAGDSMDNGFILAFRYK